MARRLLFASLPFLTAACGRSADSAHQPREAGDDGAAAAAWATWPMPNSTPGLPNQQDFDTRDANVALDRVTGLMWQRNLDDRLMAFAEAKQSCARMALGGYADWRLPSRIELVSILDVTRTQPAINVIAFPQTPSDWFWTSSVAAEDPTGSAWYVYFYFGYPKTDLVSNLFSARCVRTWQGHPPASTRYDLSADTARDVGTGLTWQRAVPAQTFTFAEASSYCVELVLGGMDGWRLPSLTELLTLIDEGARAGPMIDRAAFPDTPSEAFWSS